ncbi:BolA/IbaG family iron-sulfur metabolism protein [Vibrio sp. JC009]|uniref:BolA family protein n=1 Tax=Vibrio sp. JC009 TaxID=2912314 RepID=UPI0023AE7542|nr:BolA/IbaG family iron-sulfur metabolism protein [Vibrio sp. JC009]WED22450.1 BolA/IbaG family iron-sulfur metabolism protein [Vibrio sp. JC009]
MLQEVIETKLHQALNPSYLQVINESYLHNVPPGSESHFKVVVVSDSFEGLRPIARHRKVNEALAEELKEHIHALSIHTYTIFEWKEERGEVAPDSVKCKGGDK